MSTPEYEATLTGVELAVVGMAGRFPGAPDVDTLWRNICDGVEAVAPLSDQQLRAHGIAEDVLRDAAYVKSAVRLDGMDQFDAAFFGYSPRDAEQLDPQQRLFLETMWQALEHAGYAGEERPRATGVFAGSGSSLYLLRNLLPHAELSAAGDISALLGVLNGNESDSLTSRAAYKLNLRGPAVSVQTACSTSLTAVHLACRSLLNHETDLALAGGVWLNLLQEHGYRHQTGSILSPDGHCRAFDAAAAGTVIGSGVAVAVLKRLQDALADGDTIHAVIKGSALNNDGSAKVGYTAPSIEAQAEVIRAAQAFAEVSADTIGYVEAHGTGTTLGDPIEVAALTQAFRQSSTGRGFCALGSVKTNVGHLDAAAGITGLIKAVMAVKHGVLPPSLNFQRPNPQIDFASSPFYVNTEAKPWPTSATPRRAGVSSFGMGGTNVHVIVEEPPPAKLADPVERSAAPQLLLLSARSEAALAAASEQLAVHLERHPELALNDIAHTLRSGRARLAHRAVALCNDVQDAIVTLRHARAPRLVRGRVLSEQPSVAFLFPGQGAQHVEMGRDLYRDELVFRQIVDRCCEQLTPVLGVDLRSLVFPTQLAPDEAETQLAQTVFTQPALFVFEYALAQLWLSRGVRPDAMFGHSIGEYVAACVAGVFTLEDALTIVSARGRLLQATERGAMLAIQLAERELQPYLALGCDLAAVNGPQSCVLAGGTDTVEAAEKLARTQRVAARRLQVSHAYHSRLVEPALGELEDVLKSVRRQGPAIPFVSNVSGTWISEQQACSPRYWAEHARATVRCSEGLGLLLQRTDRILLEVGPSETLTRLARRRQDAASSSPIIPSMSGPREHAADAYPYALAQLWVHGVEVQTARGDGSVASRRVPLPSYPFERKTFWIEPSRDGARRGAKKSLDDWFYVPTWKRTEPLHPPAFGEGAALLIGEGALSEHLASQLKAQGVSVVEVRPGAEFARIGAGRYALRIAERDDWARLLRSVGNDVGPLAHACHLLCTDEGGRSHSAVESAERSFYSLLALAQALDDERASCTAGALSLTAVASGLEDVTGVDVLSPDKALLLGPCKVITQEYPGLRSCTVDVLPPRNASDESRLVSQIIAEMRAGSEGAVAYRGVHRWLKSYDHACRPRSDETRLRERGVYLITGGLGGMGLSLARHLAQRVQARLVLVGRSAVPPRGEWEAVVAAEHESLALRRKLEKLLELESLGALVMASQADVTSAAQMKDCVQRAREQFGAIHGVIHAAGVSSSGGIATRTREQASRVLAPKVDGTKALFAAVAPLDLDFLLVCSSLASIAGGLGNVDYAAANAYLDAAAAEYGRRSPFPVVSVGWDGWRDVGMAADMRLPKDVGIEPEQGAQLFERILAGPQVPQIAVATTDLADRMRGLHDALTTVVAPASGHGERRAHPRPELANAYVAPQGELAQALAEIWSELLGIAPIGGEDNFFELSGDSLLAVQVLARIRDGYGVQLHPAAFFRQPTVSQLAVLVESALIDELERSAGAAAQLTARESSGG